MDQTAKDVMRDLATALENLSREITEPGILVPMERAQNIGVAMQRAMDARVAFSNWLLSDRK